MACDTSPNHLVSSLEQWNQAKAAGQGDLGAIEKDIADQLQQEYTVLSSQAMNSDPDRLNDMRAQINAVLAKQEASCNMPHMELVEAVGGLRVVTADQDGFNVTIDETKGNLDGAALALKDSQAQAVQPTDAPSQKANAGDAQTAQKADAQSAKKADAQTAQNSEAAAPCDKAAKAEEAQTVKPHKVAPKYIPGHRPVAGEDKLTEADLHPVMEKDYCNNMVYKYRDGSSVKFDQNQPPRVTELANVRGERISLRYRGESKVPYSFVMTDKTGSVIESGFKGAHDREWNIDTQHANWKVQEAFRGAHITDIGITDDLQLCMRDRSGNFIEQHRDGDVVKRDSRGRITSEVTIVGRTTDFSYHGKDTSPSSYTVQDGGGAIIEHGERKNFAWNVFKPKKGITSLDPGSLNNPDNLVSNPADKVSTVHVNHNNGNSVIRHVNGDRTWRPSDDERLWRRTSGGAETITDPRDNGKTELEHFVGTNGVKSRYEYDKNSQVLKWTEHHPNGEVNKLSRRDISQDFVDQDGRRQRVEATHLADGSVRINWMERNSMITQRPDGSEVHEFRAKDGRRRVHSTVDTRGTTTEFVYNTTTGEPIRLKITGANGASDVWTIESPIKTGLDNPVWKNQDGTKYFEGTVSVERDGSVKYTAKDGRVTLKTLRGLTIDVTPNPTVIR